MKKDIHPAEYRPVVFEDLASGAQFLIGSTIKTTDTAKFEGKEDPKATVEISSRSLEVAPASPRFSIVVGRSQSK